MEVAEQAPEEEITKEVAEQAPPEEECLCPVCLNLLLEPTTLNCGHTVCRGCLAGWYLSPQPRRRECPTCRQKWEGSPQVNTTLRNVIERLHPEKTAERRREMEENPNYNYRSNLNKFDNELKGKKTVTTLQYRQNVGFFSGVLVAFVAVLVIYIVSSWGGSSSSKGKGRTDMPVATWKSSDVAHWLTSLVWARNYSELAQHYEVDGRALLNMDTEKLMELLNVTDPHHQNAFGLAVDSLREAGVRMPQTIWEYKALYPGRSLYLSQGMKDAPRCVTLYLYLFYYEDMFLPFLHSTVPRHWDEELQLNKKLPSPTVSQCLMFFVMMLVFPYGMVGLFAWSLRSAHTITHLLVMLTCFFQTVFELSFFSSCFLQRRWGRWRHYFKSYVKTLAYLIAFYCTWPFIPAFVGSAWIYRNLYYIPVSLARMFRSIFMGRQH